MTTFHDPISLSPKEFERKVQHILEASGAKLSNFRTIHREKLSSFDGIYEIDVTARFSALGGNFVVLVECKNQKNPIKREVVQVLHNRIQSVGAHKGMLFATTTFQKGAVEYAMRHGIALIQITQWNYSWAAFSETMPSISEDELEYVCWLTTLSKEGHVISEMIAERNEDIIKQYLNISVKENI
jgi:restriction system protein